MQLDKYLKTSAAVLEVSRANEIGGAKGLLEATQIKQDELRTECEKNPVRSDQIKKDLYFKLGMVAGMSWVLSLPGKAREWREHLPDGEDI
jgi:hypothetical protein